MGKITLKKPRPIAKFYEKTMSFKLDKKNFKKKFDDGTPIKSFEIKRIGNKLCFIRRGNDKNGNCRLWWTDVKVTPDGQVVFMQNTGGISQSCSGNPCTNCWPIEDPKSIDKCLCKSNSKGICNHTIVWQRRADFGVFLVR